VVPNDRTSACSRFTDGDNSVLFGG
jgi:hypothetical protein